MQTSELSYKDQSASDLRLGVVGGDIDYAQFQVVGQETFEADSGLLVDAKIIGASHVLTFNYAGIAVNEVLACMEIQETDRAFGGLMKDLKGPVELGFQGGEDRLMYKFVHHLVDTRLNAGDLLSFKDEIVSGRRSGLIFEFPDKNRKKITAMTLIAVDCHEGMDGVSIETGHIYPQEFLAVITRTVIRPSIGRENRCLSSACSKK